jgi:hypothetical protein
MATSGLSRKTVENVLLTLSSLPRTARAWGYACGKVSLADLTLPRAGVKKEQRSHSVRSRGVVLDGANTTGAVATNAISTDGLHAPRKRHHLTAAGRKRLSMLRKKRWAERRKKFLKMTTRPSRIKTEQHKNI